MLRVLSLLLLLLPIGAWADDIDKIVGHYVYQDYRVEFPGGRVLRFRDLGATGATIEFRADRTIAMDMQMLDGSTISSTARIVELKIDGNKGYWIAQWPDMSYPVRKDFSFHGDTFEYRIRFDDPSDPLRYGSVEHAVLKKTTK